MNGLHAQHTSNVSIFMCHYVTDDKMQNLQKVQTMAHY